MSEHPWVRSFELTAEAVLTGDRIAVESTDGKWMLENVLEGPVAFFFNNWEPHGGCIHVAPLFGSVKSAEEVKAQGLIAFSLLR